MVYCAWVAGGAIMKQTRMPDWLVITFTMVAIVTMVLAAMLLVDNL